MKRRVCMDIYHWNLYSKHEIPYTGWYFNFRAQVYQDASIRSTVYSHVECTEAFDNLKQPTGLKKLLFKYVFLTQKVVAFSLLQISKSLFFFYDLTSCRGWLHSFSMIPLYVETWPPSLALS